MRLIIRKKGWFFLFSDNVKLIMRKKSWLFYLLRWSSGDYEEGKGEMCNSHEKVALCAAERFNTDTIFRANICEPIFLDKRRIFFNLPTHIPGTLNLVCLNICSVDQFSGLTERFFKFADNPIFCVLSFMIDYLNYIPGRMIAANAV